MLDLAPRIGSKDLSRILDLSPHEVMPCLELGLSLKADNRPYRNAFAQRSIVLLFEKPSLRTRVSFEIGFSLLGGTAVYLDHEHRPIGVRETIADYGRNLERWCHCIVARTMSHATIEALSAHTKIPVINALSNLHHPCQALADFMTLVERGFDFTHDRLVWIGDGNNVCHSLIEMAATVGCGIVVVTPPGSEPNESILRDAQARACRSGASIEVTNDPARVQGAFALYTDTWTSMGEPENPQRIKTFRPYQVNAAMMAMAGSETLFMHCLPAHRGEEVTDQVIDSPCSIVFDQAENRMHMQNALMLNLLTTPTSDPLSRTSTDATRSIR